MSLRAESARKPRKRKTAVPGSHMGGVGDDRKGGGAAEKDVEFDEAVSSGGVEPDADDDGRDQSSAFLPMHDTTAELRADLDAEASPTTEATDENSRAEGNAAGATAAPAPEAAAATALTAEDLVGTCQDLVQCAGGDDGDRGRKQAAMVGHHLLAPCPPAACVRRRDVLVGVTLLDRKSNVDSGVFCIYRHGASCDPVDRSWGGRF